MFGEFFVDVKGEVVKLFKDVLFGWKKSTGKSGPRGKKETSLDLDGKSQAHTLLFLD